MPRAKKIKFCSTCLETNLRPNAYFDNSGRCLACRYYSDFREENRLQKLEYLKELIKKKKKISRAKHHFDCIVGVSGGKDSTRQAHWVKERLGLNPLLVCVSYPPLQMSEVGAKNLSNLISMGFDLFCLTPAPKTSAALSLESFTKFGNVCKSTEMALFSSVPRIAIDFGINIIFWGENPALIRGDSAVQGEDEFDGNNLRELNTLRDGGYDWMNKVSSSDKVKHYFYPEEELFNKRKISIFYLSPAWEDFTLHNNSLYASLQGLTLRPDEELITGDISNASMLDEEFTNINYMIRFYKYGIGRAADFLSEKIREKLISKEEASEIANQYDGICDDSIIKEYCKYVNIKEDFFWETVNKFTNKELFKLNKNKRPQKLFNSGG